MSNQKGFSLIEVMLASVIGIVGIGASLKIYSYVGAKGHQIDTSRALRSLKEELKPRLMADLKSNWLALGKANCSTANSNLQLSNFNTAELKGTLMDKAKLEQVLPLKEVNGKPNPLRLAINQLMADYKNQASSKCSDPNTLKNSKYSGIGVSERNQALCRCATAVTGYDTLQSKTPSLAASDMLYVCLELTSSGKNEVGLLLNQKSVLVESSYELFNVDNATKNNCQQSASGVPKQALSRLDYGLYFNESSESGKQVGTYISD